MDSETRAAMQLWLICAAMTAVSLFGDRPGQAAEAAAAEHVDWPCWSGPYTTFVATPSGSQLVDDLNDARLVWRSDEVTPMAKAHAARSGQYSAGRHGGNQDGKPSGGGSSPVVSDGRVFLSYYLPTGDVIGPESGRLRDEDSRRVIAQGVALCLDAETGKTLWTTVFEEEGINRQDGKSPGYSGLTPCVADGHLYVVSTMMRVCCLDAATGRIVWTTDTPRATEYLEASKEKALREKHHANHPFLAKQGGKNLIFAGGVLLVPVQSNLMGVDGKSGTVLWKIDGALGNTATPTRWTHQDTDYVLAANASGTIRCIEPRSGKIMWMIEDAGPNEVNVTVDGDLLIARAGQLEIPREGRKPTIVGLLGAWRITPEEAAPVWKHEDPRYALHHFHVPIPAEGHIFVRSRSRGPLICIESATGNVVAEAEVPVGSLPGTTMWVDGHLISETDGSHMSMNLHLIKANPTDLRQLGKTWLNPHPPTTSYVPAMCHAYVGGRLYVRGADGIYCYDLRKPAE